MHSFYFWTNNDDFVEELPFSNSNILDVNLERSIKSAIWTAIRNTDLCVYFHH